MRSFKQYLLHRMRSTWVLTAVLCIFVLILTVLTVDVKYIYQTLDHVEPDGTLGTLRYVSPKGEELALWVMGIMATLMPIVEFAGLKNKRNADLIYSLPVDRVKIGAAHYANGLITTFAVYLASAIPSALIFIIEGYGELYLQYLAPMYLLPLAFGAVLYTFFAFLFNEANTVADGCVFTFFGMFILLLVMFDIALVKESINDEIFLLGIGLPYYSMAKVHTQYARLMEYGKGSILEKADTAVFVFWGIVCLLALFGLYMSFSRGRAERIGEMSDTWFGYRVIIPICIFSGSLLLASAGVVWFVLLALGAVVGYMLYRRSFKIKLPDIAVTAAVMAAGYFIGV